MSPCIGLGVPMIAYTTQDRMTSFMERNDLQDYSVNAFDILEENTLCNIMKLNLENPNKIKERFLCARDSMRKEINIFNLFIYDVIRLN